jgi:hypothetical protein
LSGRLRLTLVVGIAVEVVDAEGVGDLVGIAPLTRLQASLVDL